MQNKRDTDLQNIDQLGALHLAINEFGGLQSKNAIKLLAPVVSNYRRLIMWLRFS